MQIRGKPLLFVDVDGVISLFGWEPDKRPDGVWTMVDGLPHLLSPVAAAALQTLSAAYSLVWCSGWEEKCNEYLPDALGLPRDLPTLSFARSPGKARAHWKLDAIDAFAGAQPLAWIDDAFNDACHSWAAARAASAPTLLVTTRPAVGLTALEATVLQAFADGLAAGSPADRDTGGP